MREFLLVVLGAVIGVITDTLLRDWIESVVVRLPAGLVVRPRRADIRGTWFTLWLVSPEGPNAQPLRSRGVQEIKLSQLGNQVIGRGEDKEHYRIRATLDHRVLTGTWENPYKGSDYDGSLQLIWDAEGKWILGKFLGKSRNNHINHGVWLWAREREELLPLARYMIRAGYKFELEQVKRILARDSRGAILQPRRRVGRQPDDQEH